MGKLQEFRQELMVVWDTFEMYLGGRTKRTS